MSGAIFILATNSTVAAILAFAFLFVASYDRTLRSALWMALAYSVGGIYYLSEFLIIHWPESRLLATLAFASLLLALCFYAVGIARHYRARVPWLLLGALFVVSVGLNVYAQSLPRDELLRNLLWQLPYAAAQVVSVAMIARVRVLGRLDMILAACLLLSIAHFLIKPFVAVRSGGPGETAGDYIDSLYALFSQSSGAVVGILVALVTLGVYFNEMLSDANRKSETDTLSGILNRRGFLQRIEQTLRSPAVPMTLILADIDNFKSINDRWGHATGDRVIEAFARVLTSAAGSGNAVGRIGGEEFAMLIVGGELSTARLFAESARVSLSLLEVEGLPERERITASFGVAQWQQGIGYDELFRLADAALYEAKNSGRDCVRVAPPMLTSANGRSPLRRLGLSDGI